MRPDPQQVGGSAIRRDQFAGVALEFDLAQGSRARLAVRPRCGGLFSSHTPASEWPLWRCHPSRLDGGRRIPVALPSAPASTTSAIYRAHSGRGLLSPEPQCCHRINNNAAGRRASLPRGGAYRCLLPSRKRTRNRDEERRGTPWGTRGTPRPFRSIGTPAESGG